MNKYIDILYVERESSLEFTNMVLALNRYKMNLTPSYLPLK